MAVNGSKNCGILYVVKYDLPTTYHPIPEVVFNYELFKKISLWILYID